MKWWPGWDFTKSPFDEGQIFDLRGYGGLFRSLIFTNIVLLGLWYIENLGVDRGLMNPRDHQWHRMVIIGMLAVGYISIFSLAISILIDRRKLKKRTKGQWYDNQNLSKRDLEQDDSEAGEGDGPEAKG